MSQGAAEALGVSGHRVHIVKAKQQLKIGTWTILPFDTVHDAAEPLGYLLASGKEKLLFATDTAYLKYRFRGLTHIMIEANFQRELLENSVEEGNIPAIVRNRIRRSHFDLEHLKEFFKVNDLSKLQEIWLLHLSDGNADEEMFKREIQSLTGKPTYIA